MSKAHAPGVLCIIVGVAPAWSMRNNGRIVVIERLHRVSRKHGNIWVVRTRPGEPDLHAMKRTIGGGETPVMSSYMAIFQSRLLPIGEPQDEQTVGTEVDDAIAVLA
jgi:hypothetical protein